MASVSLDWMHCEASLRARMRMLVKRRAHARVSIFLLLNSIIPALDPHCAQGGLRPNWFMSTCPRPCREISP